MLKRFIIYTICVSFFLLISCQTQDVFQPTIATQSEADVAEIRALLEKLDLIDLELLSDLPETEVQRRVDWLLDSYTAQLTNRGVTVETLSKLRIDNVNVDALLKRYLVGAFEFEGLGGPQFQDYVYLNEIAVLAEVGEPIAKDFQSWAGPYAFHLTNVRNIKGYSKPFPIVFANAISAHAQRLHTGLECIFIFSPSLPVLEASPPVTLSERREFEKDIKGLIHQRTPLFCRDDNGDYKAPGGYYTPKAVPASEIQALIR